MRRPHDWSFRIAGRTFETIVLGAGPVGRMAALAAARQGPVLLVARDRPDGALMQRVDAVPGSLLALLLEFGVHPSELGVTGLHDSRMVAWESADPVVVRGPAIAHVERTALERALAAITAQTPAVTISSRLGDDAFQTAHRVIDATGRRAISATCRIQPPGRMFSRSFIAEGHFTLAAQAFRMAALPGGYAYRLGSAGVLTVGLVGPREMLGGPVCTVELLLRRAAAGWLLAGLPALAELRPGRGGTASVQWTEGPEAVLRIGDAAMARDSLASQGLANGISDALHACDHPRSVRARQRSEHQSHILSLLANIQRCRFHPHPVWRRYVCFLAAASRK